MPENEVKTPEVDPNAEMKAQLDSIGPLENNGVVLETCCAVKRGKGGGEPYLTFVGGTWEIIVKLGTFIGVDDFVRSIFRDSINPAAQDAYSEAYDDEKDSFSTVKFIARFLDNFRAGKRITSGPLLKELKEQREVAYAELLTASTELEAILANPSVSDETKEAGKAKVNRAIMTCQQLMASIQKKERKGKGKGKVAKK